MKAAQLNTMLRAVILSAEDLLARHVDVLGREPCPEQDHEVYDLQQTIADAKIAIRRGANPCPPTSAPQSASAD